MRLVVDRDAALTFVRRRHAKGALLIGIALAVIAAVPLVSGEGVLAPRLATALVIGALAALLMKIGWPSRDIVRLSPGARTIQADGEIHPLEPDAYYRLVTRIHHEDYAWPTYRIEVATPSRVVTLLEDRRPDVVLRDFAAARAALPLPVQTGWGLPARAEPWIRPPTTEAAARDETAGGRSLEARTTDVVAQRETGWTVIIGSLCVAFLMLRSMWQRLQVGDHALTQDFVLPVLSVAVVAVTGVAVLTRSIVVRANGTISLEYRMLGIAWRRVRLPRESVTAAYSVGAAGGRPWHLLLCTTEGPVAVPAYDGGARELTEALARRL